MADNVNYNQPGTGTVMATDDVSGVQYTRVKVSHGADGSATDTSDTAPLPVAGGASDTVAGITASFDASVTSSAETLKGSAGNLYHVSIANPNTDPAYLQLFNSSSVTVGTTTPVHVVEVPGKVGVNNGQAFRDWSVPFAFSDSIKYAATTTSTGNTAPTSAIEVNFGYK